MHSLAIIGIAILLSLLLYKYFISPVFLSPLSKIPNAHFSVPITSQWIDSKRKNCSGTQTIYALHQKHGPIVRLGPNELSVCTPAALRTIYVGGFEKTRWYLDSFVNYGTQNIVSMLDYKPHSTQKRMLANIYSKSYLQSSEDLQTASTQLTYGRLLPIMTGMANRKVQLDVLDFFQGVFMDSMTAYLFGLSNATNFMDMVSYRRYWLADYKNFKNQMPLERAGGEVEKLCFSLCEKAEMFLHSEKDPEAAKESVETYPVAYGRLTQSLREAASQSEKPDSKVIMTKVASEMLDSIIAGHETSGITLSYLMWEMSQRPDLQMKLRTELLTLSPPIVWDPSSQNDSRTLPSPRSIDSLPLLSSILQETFRLHAAAPAQQPRLTPHTPAGTTLEGYSGIPGGVRVSANAYTLHRNPTVYPQPSKWLPERWMDATDERKAEMKRWFWVFGSGGRMCLGSNFAIQGMFDIQLKLTLIVRLMVDTALKLVIATIYTNYTTEIVDDEGIEQTDTFVAGPVGEKLILRFTHV